MAWNTQRIQSLRDQNPDGFPDDIVARLATIDPSWHPKTVRTLLARLVEKKALGFEASGRAYVYTPLVTEVECIAVASGSFVERVFGGALKPMLVHFL